LKNVKAFISFILDTCFLRLIEDGFCERNDCILMTGKGYPDYATREFLQNISFETSIPCFIFVGLL
jgi:meiotic recombination protein SPO11